MDYRRAGLFRQHQQCRRRTVPPPPWLRLRTSFVRRSSPNLCRSGRVRSFVCCSGLCTSLCSSCCLCSDLCCSCRLRSDLCRSSCDLLQHWLQQLLQEELLLQAAQALHAQDLLPESSLLQGSYKLLPQDLRSFVCRSGCLCSKLCRSCRLLQVS